MFAVTLPCSLYELPEVANLAHEASISWFRSCAGGAEHTTVYASEYDTLIKFLNVIEPIVDGVDALTHGSEVFEFNYMQTLRGVYVDVLCRAAINNCRIIMKGAGDTVDTCIMTATQRSMAQFISQCFNISVEEALPQILRMS